MLYYRMFVERTPYNYSEEAINRQYLKLVSYEAHVCNMSQTACASCFISDTNGEGEKKSLGTSSHYEFSCKYETGSS